MHRLPWLNSFVLGMTDSKRQCSQRRLTEDGALHVHDWLHCGGVAGALQNTQCQYDYKSGIPEECPRIIQTSGLMYEVEVVCLPGTWLQSPKRPAQIRPDQGQSCYNDL